MCTILFDSLLCLLYYFNFMRIAYMRRYFFKLVLIIWSKCVRKYFILVIRCIYLISFCRQLHIDLILYALIK